MESHLGFLLGTERQCFESVVQRVCSSFSFLVRPPPNVSFTNPKCFTLFASTGRPTYVLTRIPNHAPYEDTYPWVLNSVGFLWVSHIKFLNNRFTEH